VRCGTRVNHEVSDLQPQTEYTIRVGLFASANGAMLLRETLEARTADASTALFAGEDWARCGKNGKGNFKDGDYMKDPGQSAAASGKDSEAKAESSGGASSSSSAAASSSAGPAPAAPQAGAQPARPDSQDEVSTNAPSEAGDDREENARQSIADDNASDWGSEAELGHESTSRSQADPSSVTQERGSASASASGPSDDGEVVQVINVIDVAPIRAARECKMCSWIDCLKTSRTREDTTDSGDIVIERVVVPKPVPKPMPKRFQPYRMPFPGIPVDPGTVGRRPGPGDAHV